MKIFLLILAIILLSAMMVFVIYQPLYKHWDIGVWFYHDLLGWHVPGENESMYDGVNYHNVCKYCRLPIIQDSQGNWFITKTY